MDYELITDDDYETLPSEPEKRFTAIERICRKNMLAIISNETSQPFDSLVRTQYMTIVTASAEELGIAGIRYINEYQTVEQDLNEFFRLVTGSQQRLGFGIPQVVMRFPFGSPAKQKVSLRMN